MTQEQIDRTVAMVIALAARPDDYVPLSDPYAEAFRVTLAARRAGRPVPRITDLLPQLGIQSELETAAPASLRLLVSDDPQLSERVRPALRLIVNPDSTIRASRSAGMSDE